MRKMIMFAVLTALMVPAIASATHVNWVDLNGNCEGWTASFNVDWRENVYTADVTYSITLMSGDTVLEQVNGTTVVTRPMDGPYNITYTISGPWTGTFSGAAFHIESQIHLVADWNGTPEESTVTGESNFSCTVANEAQTWSTIKALYE